MNSSSDRPSSPPERLWHFQGVRLDQFCRNLLLQKPSKQTPGEEVVKPPKLIGGQSKEDQKSAKKKKKSRNFLARKPSTDDDNDDAQQETSWTIKSLLSRDGTQEATGARSGKNPDVVTADRRHDDGTSAQFPDRRSRNGSEKKVKKKVRIVETPVELPVLSGSPNQIRRKFLDLSRSRSDERNATDAQEASESPDILANSRNGGDNSTVVGNGPSNAGSRLDTGSIIADTNTTASQAVTDGLDTGLFRPTPKPRQKIVLRGSTDTRNSLEIRTLESDIDSGTLERPRTIDQCTSEKAIVGKVTADVVGDTNTTVTHGRINELKPRPLVRNTNATVTDAKADEPSDSTSKTSSSHPKKSAAPRSKLDLIPPSTEISRNRSNSRPETATEQARTEHTPVSLSSTTALDNNNRPSSSNKVSSSELTSSVPPTRRLRQKNESMDKRSSLEIRTGEGDIDSGTLERPRTIDRCTSEKAIAGKGKAEVEQLSRTLSVDQLQKARYRERSRLRTKRHTKRRSVSFELLLVTLTTRSETTVIRHPEKNASDVESEASDLLRTDSTRLDRVGLPSRESNTNATLQGMAEISLRGPPHEDPSKSLLSSPAAITSGESQSIQSKFQKNRVVSLVETSVDYSELFTVTNWRVKENPGQSSSYSASIEKSIADENTFNVGRTTEINQRRDRSLSPEVNESEDRDVTDAGDALRFSADKQHDAGKQFGHSLEGFADGTDRVDRLNVQDDRVLEINDHDSVYVAVNDRECDLDLVSLEFRNQPVEKSVDIDGFASPLGDVSPVSIDAKYLESQSEEDSIRPTIKASSTDSDYDARQQRVAKGLDAKENVDGRLRQLNDFADANADALCSGNKGLPAQDVVDITSAEIGSSSESQDISKFDKKLRESESVHPGSVIWAAVDDSSIHETSETVIPKLKTSTSVVQSEDEVFWTNSESPNPATIHDYAEVVWFYKDYSLTLRLSNSSDDVAVVSSNPELAALAEKLRAEGHDTNEVQLARILAPTFTWSWGNDKKRQRKSDNVFHTNEEVSLVCVPAEHPLERFMRLES